MTGACHAERGSATSGQRPTRSCTWFAKGLPCRGRWLAAARAILFHRGFGYVNAQLAQLSDDPRRTPGGIRSPHRLDELADVLSHGGATEGSLLTQAPPVAAKALLLPGDDRAGLDER